MRPIIPLKIRFLSEKEQEEHNCRLATPMDIAIYQPIFNDLGFKSLRNPYGLLLGENSIINIWVSPLSLPVKIGEADNIFVHSALKGFFQENETIYLFTFNEFVESCLNKFNGIRIPKLVKTNNLRDATALRLPRGYQRRRFLPGQIFFGINREDLKIHKFELIGFGRENKIEISYKRNDVDFLQYLIAANKTYSYVKENIARRRFPVNRSLTERIKLEDLNLKEQIARRVLRFFKTEGHLPSRIDMVSNIIKCPLNFETNVLDYLFGPVSVNFDSLSPSEFRKLEDASKRILAYVTKKQRNGKEANFYLTDVFYDLKLNIRLLKMAWTYINRPLNEERIGPREAKKIDKVSRIIINMTQSKKGIPTLYEVMSKGFTLSQVKKGFKKAQDLLQREYQQMETVLKIPPLLNPVDETVNEFLEEIGINPKETLQRITQKEEKDEITHVETLPETIEEQIKAAKFQQAVEEPIKFIGNPDNFLKNMKAIIENEVAFTKIKERINTENEVYFSEIIYAYLDKKKNLHFSVGVKITGHVANQTGEAKLEVRSNNLNIADRFFNIFKDKLDGVADIVSEDQFINDSNAILNYLKNFGAEKNWTNVEEVTLRLNFTTERAQRVLDYMEETRVAIKDEKASTGIRYYFPGLVE